MKERRLGKVFFFVFVFGCARRFFRNINAHFSLSHSTLGKLLVYQGDEHPLANWMLAAAVVDINKPAHCEAWERKKLINKFLIIHTEILKKKEFESENVGFKNFTKNYPFLRNCKSCIIL